MSELQETFEAALLAAVAMAVLLEVAAWALAQPEAVQASLTERLKLLLPKE